MDRTRPAGRTLLILLAAACLGTLPALEGTITARPRAYDKTNAPHYGYLEYLPPGYASGTTKYPLVVFLHGIGERGTGDSEAELRRVEANGPPRMIRDGRDFPAIVISPQAPPSGVGWFWSKYVVDLILHCKTRYRVDPDRVYLTGLSAGGGTAWLTADSYPGCVSALAVVCGADEATNSSNQGAGLRRLPLWAFHNQDDTVVYPSKTQRWMNAIATASGSTADVLANRPAFPSGAGDATAFTAAFSAGFTWRSGVVDRSPASPLYTLYASGGHDSWTKTYANQTVWDWLLAQRSSMPTIGELPDRTIAIDGDSGALALAIDAARLHPDYLRVSATSSDSRVIAASGIVLGGSGAARTIRITPVAGAVGTSTITVTVSDWALTASDAGRRTATKSFKVTVTAQALAADAVDLIVDNRDRDRVSTTGTWATTSFTPGFHGSDYLCAAPGSDSSATYRPRFERAGCYRVSLCYPANSSRGIATVTVSPGGGKPDQEIAVDQRVATSSWAALGTFHLAAGDGPAVTICSLDAGGYVIADAVRFESVPCPIDLIIDNTDRERVTMTGGWTATTSTAGFYGANYVSTAPARTNRVVYRPNLTRSATVRISLWYPASASRGTSPVTVAYGDGSSTTVVQVDQRENGGRWVSLGTYPCDAGTGPAVTIGCQDTGGWIGADAVRFEETTVSAVN